MDEKVKIWIQKQRDAGKSTDDIRAGLKKSGWTDDKIDQLVPKDSPQSTIKKPNKWLLIGASAFLVVGLTAALVLAYLAPSETAFTYETCLENEIPESACESLEALQNKQPLEEWVTPQTLAVIGEGSTIGDVLPDNVDVTIDVTSWLVSDIEGAGSATVCANTDAAEYLVLMTNGSGDWKVEVTLELDENGTNPLFGDTSYCQG